MGQTIKYKYMENQKEVIIDGKKFGTGVLPDAIDERDYSYDEMAMGAAPVDWEKGFDIEKEIGVTLPIKNQDGSSSCVGQGMSYYVAVLNALELGKYIEVSAKGIYSQIFLPNGGAYLRDACKLIVNWGSLYEEKLASYENGNPPSEKFMKDNSWKNDEMDKLAKALEAKSYAIVKNVNIDTVAMAIRDNYGVLGGVYGQNNGTWGSNEPKPPVNTEWAHCIYFGKFGIDEKGKYIATPNSWGTRRKDKLHPDGWQKLREDYFNNKKMFNPWTLVDKINPEDEMSSETRKIMAENEKKIVMEGTGKGRKGIIVNGELREIRRSREAAAALYVLTNNGLGTTVDTKSFDEMKKGPKF